MIRSIIEGIKADERLKILWNKYQFNMDKGSKLDAKQNMIDMKKEFKKVFGTKRALTVLYKSEDEWKTLLK